MASALDQISTRATPQTETVTGRSDQVANTAGGRVFAIDDLARLRRFLILGVDQGTYYASPQKLAKDNAAVVFRLSEAGDRRLVDTIVDISLRGAAPRQTSTLFALAVACASPDDTLRAAALDAIPKVCRTFTMLATFLRFVAQFRGEGRGLRRSIARFYTDRTAEQVAHQMVKYRNREGWTHRDVLRIAHPQGPTDDHRALYDWACGRDTNQPSMVAGYEAAQAASDPTALAALIATHNLPWEAVPQTMLNEAPVLEALLPHMGATALLRQLPRLTRAGLLTPFSDQRTAEVAARLTDPDFLRAGRVHPMQMLIAARTYASGRSVKGSTEWTAAPLIVDALDDAFTLCFDNVEPAGKRTLNAIDVSGSMDWAQIADTGLTAREAAAAIAMSVTRTEPAAYNMAFCHEFVPVTFTARSTLRDVLAATAALPFGRTDCALPMLWARTNCVEVDTFVVYTDNETWAGNVHPFQALRDYRQATGIDARLVVCAFTATHFTIADPTDPGMLDVVGLDPATPKVVADFSAGRI